MKALFLVCILGLAATGAKAETYVADQSIEGGYIAITEPILYRNCVFTGVRIAVTKELDEPVFVKCLFIDVDMDFIDGRIMEGCRFMSTKDRGNYIKE